MAMNPFPAEKLAYLDAWNTKVIWSNIETYEVPYRVHGARTWEVSYVEAGNPDFAESTPIGTISLLPNGIYEGETTNGSRYCRSLDDAELFVVMSWSGDWKAVSRGEVDAPILKVA